MGAIKLWITDIDGTILDETNVFSKRVLETIEKVKKSDTKMVVATGRMFNGAKGVADFLGLDTPVVCYQGAMVKLGDKILHQAPVKEELARDVIKVLREKNIHTNLYNNDELIVEDDNKKIMSDYCQGRFTTYRAVDSFDNVELKNVYKLLAIVYDENKMQELIKFMQERYKGVLCIVRSHKYYMEITDPNATKGAALDFLKDYWGIAKSDVLATGDQDNDYEMLKNAGIKVAMENASPKLKEIADYICPDVKQDGVCAAVERYVLCE